MQHFESECEKLRQEMHNLGRKYEDLEREWWKFHAGISWDLSWETNRTRVFTCFPKLPLEIRQKIWRSVAVPRIIQLDYDYPYLEWRPKRSKTPVISRVSQESRKEFLLMYRVLSPPDHRPPVYFHSTIDTLFLDSNIAWYDYDDFRGSRSPADLKCIVSELDCSFRNLVTKLALPTCILGVWIGSELNEDGDYVENKLLSDFMKYFPKLEEIVFVYGRSPIIPADSVPFPPNWVDMKATVPVSQDSVNRIFAWDQDFFFARNDISHREQPVFNLGNCPEKFWVWEKMMSKVGYLRDPKHGLWGNIRFGVVSYIMGIPTPETLADLEPVGFGPPNSYDPEKDPSSVLSMTRQRRQ